jgi:hypothetical protein
MDLMLIKETDLNPSVQYEDLRAEDTAQPEVEVAEGESSVQAIGGGNDQVFGFGFSGERSLSQKNNHDHSPTLNQFVPPLSSSQSFTAGNQAILKQAYPAASSAGSGFPHLSKRRSREIAQRTSLPKGSRNLAAKADLTSRDDWQKANHTTANQMLTSVDRADDILNVTSFNQIQRYQGTPPHVQVLPKTLPATFFSCNRTPFDEHATAPYMPSQQSTAFLNPLQNHMQTQIIPPITCYGRTQMPVQPSYTSPSANAQRSQQPTMSFASSQSPFFYNTPDEPPSRN